MEGLGLNTFFLVFNAMLNLPSFTVYTDPSGICCAGAMESPARDRKPQICRESTKVSHCDSPQEPCEWWEESLWAPPLLQGLLSPPSSFWGHNPCLPQPVLLKIPVSSGFPASLLSWFGSASAVGAGGFLTRGLCLMGDPRALPFAGGINILHQVFEHPLLQMKSVGSCIHFKFQSPFSFDLHLVSRANSGKCLISSSLADVCDFIRKSQGIWCVFFP